jgi:hypothetical protein
LAALLELGYRIVPTHVHVRGWKELATLSPAAVTQLARLEHDIWLRDRLPKGVMPGPVTDDRLLIHVDACHFDELPEDHKEYDRAIVRDFPTHLKPLGFKLIHRTAKK